MGRMRDAAQPSEIAAQVSLLLLLVFSFLFFFVWGEEEGLAGQRSVHIKRKFTPWGAAALGVGSVPKMFKHFGTLIVACNCWKIFHTQSNGGDRASSLRCKFSRRTNYFRLWAKPGSRWKWTKLSSHTAPPPPATTGSCSLVFMKR